MAYMHRLSATMRESADWLLTCYDGKVFPCHSLLLASASEVLAGLSKTVKTEVGEKTKVPLEETAEVAETFLCWVYNREITFEAPMAYQLAALAHRLDIPGVLQSPQCFLRRNFQAPSGILSFVILALLF